MTQAEAAAEKYADGTLTLAGLDEALDSFFASGMADREIQPGDWIWWESFNWLAESKADRLRFPTAPPRTVNAWLTSSRTHATRSTTGPTN